MSFDPTIALETIETALNAMNPKRFVEVRVGSPPDAVLPSGYTAVISVESIRVVQLTLLTAIELHTVRIGIYRAKAAAPDRADALLRYLIPSEVLDALKADFTLGGQVLAIDEGGMYGATPGVEFADAELAEKPYWTAHISLPLIIDSPVVFAA